MIKELSVTIYGHDTCPPCKQVKAYLDRKNIPYEYKNALKEPKYLEEMLYHSDNQRIFPVILTPKGTMIGLNMPRLVELVDFKP